MRKFEVPYNFDLELINELKKSDFRENISCVYLPCFYLDGGNSRKNLILEEKYPKTWEEYKKHLLKIKELSCPMILFQEGTSFNTIKKYYNLGAKKFCLTDDKLAKEIKSNYKDVETVLSITRCIKDDELQNSDLSMYDNIVLPFRYCRAIQLFDDLPKDKKYILLVNSHCLYNCNRCKAHWHLNANNLEEYLKKEQDLIDGYCCNVYSEERAYIPPCDLKYFDKYISDYKLVDRLEDTEIIMEYFINYNTNINKVGKDKSWYELETSAPQMRFIGGEK